MPAGEKTEDIRRIAAQAIVAGSTHTKAAEAAGVSRQTIHRWLTEDEEFQEMLQGLRAEALDQFTGKLAKKLDLVIDTLDKAARGEQGVSHVQVRGAQLLAELYFRSKEHSEMSERMDRLEQQLDGQQEGYR